MDHDDVVAAAEAAGACWRRRRPGPLAGGAGLRGAPVGHQGRWQLTVVRGLLHVCRGRGGATGHAARGTRRVRPICTASGVLMRAGRRLI